MRDPSILIRTTFPERPSGFEALRALALATAYDKSTRLDVPVFLDHDRRLDLAETVELACPIDALGPSPDQDLLARAAAAVARVMSAQARFEPHNDTPIHRRYPSPRSLFPVKADFVFARPDGETRLRYEPDHGALYGGSLGEGAAELRIELVADLKAIAPLYGDLAPTLCALEAGHLGRLLAAELSLAGLAAEVLAAAAPAPARAAAGGPGDLEVVLVAIRLTPCQATAPTRDRFDMPVRRIQPRLSDEDQARVRRTAERLRCGPLRARRLFCDAPAEPAGDGQPMAAPSPRRSSGYFPNGIGGLFAPTDEVDALAEMILERSARLAANDPDLYPDVTLLRPQPNFDVAVVRADGPARRRSTLVRGCFPLSEAYGTAFNIDLQTVPIILLFSAAMGPRMASGSAWIYAQTLAATGVIAQDVCDQCAARGYFARPFKGMIEQVIESAFALEDQVFYTLLIGKGRAANPGLSLAPLPHVH